MPISGLGPYVAKVAQVSLFQAITLGFVLDLFITTSKASTRLALIINASC